MARATKNRLAAQERIIEAAEQLFARRGIDPVSLQDIVAAAGERNTSAVQYHFGSRQHLLEAIFAFRSPEIEPRRLALLADLERNRGARDLRSLVEVMVYSLAGSLQRGSCYARFVAQAMYDPVRRHVMRKDVHRPEGSRRLEARRLAAMRRMPTAVRRQRFRLAWRVLLQTLALHECELETQRRPLMSTSALAAELVESILGMMTAPLAPVRRCVLRRTGASRRR